MANFEHAEDESKHVKMPGGIPDVSRPVQPDYASTARGGGFGGVPCTIPSFASALELLSAPYSCLVMNTHRRHIALPPVYMYKKKTGIQEELETELLKFTQSLNGVPLAYDNIRIVGKHGDIYDDSGYIHMNVEANFIVFQPQKGQKLLGKVNKLGVSHVGCLVHGCFNASIPKPNLVSVETWRDAGPSIGAELEFEVTALDADAAGVLLIRGRLDRTRVQELLAMAESSESTVPAEQLEPSNTEPTSEATQEPPDDTPKKKKKKKKAKIKEEENEEEVNGIPPGQLDINAAPDLNRTADETNGAEAGEKKKKKKKKDMQVKEEEEEVMVSPMEIQGSDSSGYLSDKPSKKRKHEASGLNNDPAPTKPKKKKKGDIEQFA
ncbi:DNA-directed RNA polymerase I subunit RPA43 [Melanotaenia boesemani]|uniref:DNA-directed RNA polymerase I subunit RPA43 n=1 Tax=Melanotaenia boesemani TaxID=1250792 RepID=UPI001C03F6A6|nr:DNA-directed RNA polymerase I subunit RPA43 [Melanotaenia boesemani]